MASPDSENVGSAPRVQPGEPHGASLGLTYCASLATEPNVAADSSTPSDIRACVQLLDRVWPREGALAPPPNPVPATLGRFRILRELGRGGFGVVFLAEDPVLGRKLALKVPRVEVLSRGDAWRQFLREAMAASRLDHPNLVPLLETGEIGAVGYIASVYVEGLSLEAWLARQQEPMPPRQAARLIVTLARAMDHVHQRGILHRDLKPANVLLQESGTGDPASSARDGESLPFVPRICDFGLAKLLDLEAEDTRSLVIAGSPSYMAPEQAEVRKEEIGPATDVYGLGAILYELLAGRPPFRGKTSLETLRQVVTEEPIPPRQLRPGVTRDLETICLKCLAKKPVRRYSTAAALADDLERFLEGRPIQARPAPAWERAWKWGRRRPTLASLAMLSILTVFAGLLGLLVLARMNEQLGEALVQARRLVATYRVRQAQQAVSATNLEVAQDLLGLAGPDLGSAGARGFAWNYLQRQLNDRLEVLEGHEATVGIVEGSSDGRTLASGDAGGAVRLWDLNSGGSRVLEPHHQGAVDSLSFSPDGRSLASTALTVPGEVYLWDVATGTFKGRVQHVGPTIYGAWFTPDGARVLALNHAPFNHPHRLLSWAIANPDTAPLVPDPAKVRELGLFDHRLQAVADLLDGKDSSADLAHAWSDPGPRGLAFTRDGALAVVGSGGGRFQLLSAQGGPPLGVGRLSRTGGVQILYHHAMAKRFQTHIDLLVSLDKQRPGRRSGLAVNGIVEDFYAFSPRNQEVALWVPGRPGPYLVDSLTWRETASSCPLPPVQVSSIHCLPDGQTVAFTSPDHQIRLWHLDPSRDPSVPRGHAPFEAWAVAYSPDGRTLATSGDDHLIRFWDPDTGAELAPARGHGSLVTSIAWSPDGTTLASVSMAKNRRVCLWRVATGTRTDLNGHAGKVRTVAFSPDGRMLATGSDDRTIRLWDTGLGDQVCELSGHTEAVSAVAFSPDGRSLATGGWDGRILWWDLPTRMSRTFATGPQVSSLAFSPDGKALAASHHNGPTQLYDVATGKTRAILLGHHGGVNRVAFSPDGLTLATAGMDQTVRIWDTASGQEMLWLTGHKARVNGVAFSPDGGTLASVDHDGAVRLWRASSPGTLGPSAVKK